MRDQDIHGGNRPARRTPKRRTPIVVGALVAAALLIAGGVFAAVKLTGHHSPPAAAPTSAAAVSSGPFTGTYRADYDPPTGPGLDGKVIPGAQPATITWGVRSVCQSAGCVAVAARLSGDATS